MSATSFELPELLREVRTRPLLTLFVQVRKPQIVGSSPDGYRRIGVIANGSFEGERLSGEVIEGGSDWQRLRPDGATTIDVRLVLRTRDEALIAMQYRGFRHGPADVLARLDRGEVVDPAEYYMRICPFFETAAPQYQWLNRIIAVGIGHRNAQGALYSLFEIL
jgi:hypothetical protein